MQLSLFFISHRLVGLEASGPLAHGPKKTLLQLWDTTELEYDQEMSAERGSLVLSSPALRGAIEAGELPTTIDFLLDAGGHRRVPGTHAPSVSGSTPEPATIPAHLCKDCGKLYLPYQVNGPCPGCNGQPEDVLW